MDLNFDFDEKIEQLAKVPKPIRLGAVSTFLLLVAAGFYFFSYQPQQRELTKMRVKSQELQRKLNSVRSVANNVTAFSQEVADLERDLADVLTQLPNKKQFEDLLQDISTSGKKVGVTIKGIEIITTWRASSNSSHGCPES
jgi:Tfp pilus assembly protein PilO